MNENDNVTVEEKPGVWEILVPVRWDHVRHGGELISKLHHQEWDRKVLEIASGLTINRIVRGRWLSESDSEEMIPVRIACSTSQIIRIADLTAAHYKQTTIFFYPISNVAYIRHYPG